MEARYREQYSIKRFDKSEAVASFLLLPSGFLGKKAKIMFHIYIDMAFTAFFKRYSHRI